MDNEAHKQRSSGVNRDFAKHFYVPTFSGPAEPSNEDNGADRMVPNMLFPVNKSREKEDPPSNVDSVSHGVDLGEPFIKSRLKEKERKKPNRVEVHRTRETVGQRQKRIRTAAITWKESKQRIGKGIGRSRREGKTTRRKAKERISWRTFN